MRLAKDLTVICVLACKLFFTNTLYAQSPKLHFISKVKPIYVDSIKRIKTDTLLYVKFEFAKFKILNPEIFKKIRDRTVIAIDLVYSTHVEAQSFDQYQLNLQRLIQLNTIAPELFVADHTKWNIIGQTHFKTNLDAQKLFSGFVIHLRPLASVKETEYEIKMLDDILEGKLVDILPTIPSITYKPKDYRYKGNCYGFDESKRVITSSSQTIILKKELVKKPRFKGGENSFYKQISENVIFVPERKFRKKEVLTGVYSFVVNQKGEVSNIKTKSGNATSSLNKQVLDAIEKTKLWTIGNTNGQSLEYNFVVFFSKEKKHVPYSNLLQNVVVRDLKLCSITNIDTTNTIIKPRIYSVPDSTIFNVFNRNPKWKKMLVVADLTGSMYPYTAQLLLWFKLKLESNINPILHLTFFNDGDHKDTFDKRIGNTGGIYNSKAQDFDELLDLAKRTMLNGDGGDTPENNIEAVISGINACKECDEIVMIADNFATPRDLELISKVNKPIKIIVCSTWGGINPNYLNIAMQNKGSIHTFDSDIINLAKVVEGQQVNIEGIKYNCRNGKFKRNY